MLTIGDLREGGTGEVFGAPWDVAKVVAWLEEGFARESLTHVCCTKVVL